MSKKMSNLIEELEKKICDSKPVCPYNEKNKKDIEEVVNNAKELYKTRNDIIDIIEEAEKKGVNLNWLKGQNMFKKLVEDVEPNLNLSVAFGRKKNKKNNLKEVQIFLDKIQSGKVYDAEKEFKEKIYQGYQFYWQN